MHSEKYPGAYLYVNTQYVPSSSCPAHVSLALFSSPELPNRPGSAPNASIQLAGRHVGREARTNQSSPGRNRKCVKRFFINSWTAFISYTLYLLPLPSLVCAGISCRSFQIQPPVLRESDG